MTKTTIILSGIAAAVVLLLLAGLRVSGNDVDPALLRIKERGGQIDPPEAKLTGDVIGVSVRNSSFDDNDLTILNNFPNLRYLDLSFTKVKGHGLKQLNNLTRLTDLNLSSTLVYDQGLPDLHRFGSLKNVYLDYTYLELAGLMQFVKAFEKRKVSLSLMGAVVIDGKSFSGPTLVSQKMEKVKPAFLLSIFTSLEELEILDLSRTGMEDYDLMPIRNNFKKLEGLYLSYNNLTNQSLPTLAALGKLTTLDLSGNKDVDDGGQWVEGCWVGDDDSEDFVWSFPSLGVLSGWWVGDDDDDKLTDLVWYSPGLERLSLAGTGITNSGLHRLCLNKLRSLDISDTTTNLDEKVLCGTRRDNWQRWLGVRLKIKDCFRSLEELLVNKTGVSDNEMDAIGWLTELRYLDLSDTSVTNARLEKLVRDELTKLDALTLPSPSVALQKRLTAIRPIRFGVLPARAL